MAGSREPTELVRHARLETNIQQHHTIHTRPRGRRGFGSREVWVQERMIGHGGYGQVWMERKLDSAGRPTPDLRAVKCIYASAGRREYLRELEALAKFSSNSNKYAEFFVQFYGWYESPGWLHTAMEYCEQGDLKNHLQKHKTLTEKEMQEITLQVLGGLSLMHEAGFAHGDVKPGNILIKSSPPEDWWVKLCDFGLSKRAEVITGSTTVRGTPAFMPPEILGFNSEDPKKANSFSADMWCLGETVFEALTGRRTFKTFKDQIDYVNGSAEFPQAALQEAKVGESGIRFIHSLMSPIPLQRLTAEQALDQPWMIFDNEVMLHAADDLPQTQTRLQQLDLEGSGEISQASADWTRSDATKAAADLGQNRDEHLLLWNVDLSSKNQASESIKDERNECTDASPGTPGTKTAIPSLIAMERGISTPIPTPIPSRGGSLKKLRDFMHSQGYNEYRRQRLEEEVKRLYGVTELHASPATAEVNR